MHNRKYYTLEERQKLVLAGIEGTKGKLHPFKDIKVDVLKPELAARGIADMNKTKPELTKDLKDSCFAVWRRRIDSGEPEPQKL